MSSGDNDCGFRIYYWFEWLELASIKLSREVKCHSASQLWFPGPPGLKSRRVASNLARRGRTEGDNVEGRLLTMKEWEEVAREARYNPAKMAALCSISERQLQRLFQQHLKCTPSRWLRQLQCRLAKQLISQGYSNKAVASELRFSSQSHFCREFKKVFGTSPRLLPLHPTRPQPPPTKYPGRAGSPLSVRPPPPWTWRMKRANLELTMPPLRQEPPE